MDALQLSLPKSFGKSLINPSDLRFLYYCFIPILLLQPVNCLFLHLFVAKDGYHQSAIVELLRTCFISLPLLHYIFLSLPPSSDASAMYILSDHFSRVPAINEEPAPNSTQLWVTHRHQYFPVLHIRSAKVEDYDDLMPIFQHCSALEVYQQYGKEKYYR